MQFFLCEIVARVVAIYLFIDLSRTLWHGLVERKIRYFSRDVLDWLVDWWSPGRVVHRDAAPVQYWLLMGTQTISWVACFLLAIFGWWHPDT
jgi:hypothetical protein